MLIKHKKLKNIQMNKIILKTCFALLLPIMVIVSCQEEDLPKANFNTSLVTSIDAASSHEKVMLSWIKPIKDVPAAYRVSWTPNGEAIDLAVTESTYEIAGLEINTDYVFSVQAVYEDGVSGKRNIEITIPDEISFKAFAGSEFVQLQWSTPNRDDLVGYEIMTSANSQTIELDENATSYVIADLENDTEYSFTLTPKYQDGLGNSIEQLATPGFVEMIFSSTTIVNSGEPIDFSYNPAFLLNQEIASYSWDFKDGTTDNTQDPSHTFNTPGRYEVTLDIVDTNNISYSSTKTIDIVGINWEFATSSHIKGITALRGDDGTLYIGDSAGTFYAINPDGTEKWNLSLTTASGSQELYDGSPALGQDGNIYVTSQNGNLYSITQSGSINWIFTTINSADMRMGPAIANDGTIYINDRDGNFYAVNPDGTQKWSFAHAGGGDSNPAIAPDGTVYFGSDDDNLYALNPDGTEKWKYTTGGNVDSSPSIGSDGTVYFGAADNMFYAVSSEGGLNWSFSFDGQRTLGTPIIGTDGTVFVGVRDNKLYAFNAGGGLKWSTEFRDRFVFASATLDANGNLYIGDEAGYLSAVNQEDGILLWEVLAGKIFSSPTIGEGGNIFIGTLIDSNVAPAARFLSIYGAATTLADSPWPTKRGNKNQTGMRP